jgi:hypothetical protein
MHSGIVAPHTVTLTHSILMSLRVMGKCHSLVDSCGGSESTSRGGCTLQLTLMVKCTPHAVETPGFTATLALTVYPVLVSMRVEETVVPYLTPIQAPIITFTILYQSPAAWGTSWKRGRDCDSDRTGREGVGKPPRETDWSSEHNYSKSFVMVHVISPLRFA